MDKARTKQKLHICFHNPNSQEATVKVLTKIIAQTLANHYLQQTNGEWDQSQTVHNNFIIDGQ